MSHKAESAFLHLVRQLKPLKVLSEEHFKQLLKHSDLLRLARGAKLLSQGMDAEHLLFLTNGELLLDDGYGSVLKIDERNPRCRYPLVPEDGAETSIVCLRDSRLLRVHRGLLKRLQALSLAEAKDQSVDPDLISEERIYVDFISAMKSRRVELPAIPDTAVRVARHIESDEANNENVARVIQTDPAITARLIQVCNSPAFGGRTRIASCRDAITRLGLRTTRNLVTGFVLKGLFRTQHTLIRQRMRALWEHSVRVAAISYVIAKRHGGFDPWQALLAGLVHDIGVIPILNGAHKYARLIEDAEALERVIMRLRGELSVIVLREWGFLTEFSQCAQHAEDWLRDSQNGPDLADIIITAQVHARFGGGKMDGLPPMANIPAVHKLALGHESPAFSLSVLEQAQHEIDDVCRLIG
jgi:HD-like signal output (HDOD) protein